MTKPTLYITPGPTGSGKTTIYHKLKTANPELVLFSWDEFKLAWYDPSDYSKAWELANQDKTFINKTYDIYHKLLKQKKSVFVDHSSLTVRRRKTWITPAKKLGYNIILIDVKVPLEELLARRSTRQDKYISEYAVHNQYNCLQAPSVEEGYDEVLTANEIK